MAVTKESKDTMGGGMMRLRMVVGFALLVGTIGCHKAEQRTGKKETLHPLRLGEAVVPLSQELNLGLYPDSEGYTGTTLIALDIREASDSLRLHAEGINLLGSSLEQDGRVLTLKAQPETTGLMVFRSPEKFHVGAAKLHITFSQTYGTTAAGLYKVKTGGRNYLFTQFESSDARKAFPCFDEPGFKIPWSIELSIPATDIAVGNYPALPEPADTEAAAKIPRAYKRVRFARTDPMPSYLVALSVGEFDTVPITGMSVPGRVVTVKGQGRLAAAAAKMAPDLLGTLEKYFHRTLPYPKLDLISVPEFNYGAMENPGSITFRENILLFDSSEATTERRRRLASVMAHEMSHLWFGDLVTMAWWDDIWLNESFASWMGNRTVTEAFPRFKQDVQEVEGRQWAMYLDAQHTARAVRNQVLPTDNIGQSFDGLAYEKGQQVLGMLEAWIGDSVFQAGIRAYMGKFAWKNARGADLWETLGHTSGRDVAGVMAGFLNHAGVPMVTLETRGKTIRLQQRRFLLDPDSSDKRTWKVPVVLRCETGGRTYRESYLLETAEAELTPAFAAEGMLCHPNEEERGYYRWNLSPSALDSLVARGSDILTERERVALVGDLDALANAGVMANHALLQELAAFASDTSPLVLQSVIDAVGGVDYRVIDAKTEAGFGAYVAKSFAPTMDRIGWAARPGEDPLIPRLRSQLLELLADKGRVARAGKVGDSLAALILKDRRRVDPDLAITALKVAASHGGVPLFRTYRKAFEAAETPVLRTYFLWALESFRNPAVADSVLAYALTSGPRTNEFMYFAEGLGRRRELQGRVLDWVMGNFETLVKRRPADRAVNLVWFGTGSPELWAKAQPFFAARAQGFPGMDKEMAKAEEDVRHREAVAQRDGEAMAKYLAGFLPIAAGRAAKR
jgi:alanyl aminopeptidase